MVKFARLLIGVCAAVVALAMLAGPARALRSLELSNPGSITATGVRVTFHSGFLDPVCTGVTINGTLNERIAKRPGAVVGSITEARTADCRFAFLSVTVVIHVSPGDPIPKVYNSVRGTLPVISNILVLHERVRFDIIVTGRTCRYEGRAGFLFFATRETRGALLVEGGEFLAEPKARLIREGSTEECPAEASPMGRLRLERPRVVTLV